MKQLTDAEIAWVLGPYKVEVTPILCDQIRVYSDLLLRWNRRISLTTVMDPIEILRFHFGESLFAVSSVPIRHGRLADVGSGAGFPAIPIRMASKDLQLALIESNRKKSAFLAEVARELCLSGVVVHSERMEEMREEDLKVDFITARAVAVDNLFLEWSAAHLKATGKVALWLGREDSERVSQSATQEWRAPIKIPGTDRRVILVGSKL